MTKLENEQLLHQIQVERVENGLVQKCLNELQLANKRISRELRKTDGVFTKARYKEIRKYLKDIARELKSNINSSMDIDEFIDYELKAQLKLFKKAGGISLIAPSKEQLITTATFTPYTSNSTFANYLDSFEYNYFNVWDSAVRTGYLIGEKTPAIIRKVIGYSSRDSQVADYGEMRALQNSIAMNTRTALQSFASETRNMIYHKNQKLFDGYKWLATLDRRTCIYCGSKEGKIYPSLESIGDVPPAHYNCRCTVVPVIDGMEELDSTRASENGQVESDMTFEKWLGYQSSEVQKDILGEYRYKQFKEGVPIKSFIADNRILTIQELKNQE